MNKYLKYVDKGLKSPSALLIARLVAILVIVCQLGCSSTKVKEYAEETPVLSLQEYFNGEIDAYGIFQNRSGKVVKRFHVLMRASWKGDVGTLDETFTYSDNSTSRRVWILQRTGKNTFTGTAGDVVGQAYGEVAGNTFYWNYVLDLEVDGSHYHVKFDDWMYLMDKKIMLNKSKMSKWGFDLGEVTLTFIKR